MQTLEGMMRVDDFEAYFEALWGYKPFPWQSALMRHVADKGWPEMLDLPTSSGKTSVIDIALFHLALEAGASKSPGDRKAPLRIIFTIDRRLVVDDAYTRACAIKKRLIQAPSGSVLAEVAAALRAISSSEAEAETEPLKVLRLRGGVPRERVFIANPLQPTIILSTVDQVGSRLLFRGYGISSNMRPVHAALVGMDSLIILDEAHLSRPFEETLAWVKRYQSSAWAEMMVCRPNIMVRMTATPSEKTEVLLQADDWTHPVLGPRLKCSKPAKLVAIPGDKEKSEENRMDLAKTLVAQAVSLMPESGASVVGVVVNRVATARQVFELLCARKGGDEAHADAILLIGRARPLDREAIVDKYLKRMRAGRKDEDNPRPLYVVATQTVEVGADLDFDALVTESAALDALRQRFGRLNRLGRHELAHAAIVHVDYGRSKITDPIYGDALTVTWKWLSQNAGRGKVIDFGIQAMGVLLAQAGDVTEMLMPRKRAPLLLPAHMDMLVQTNPAPAVEPDVAPYLHGPATELEDVQLIWRADLPSELTDENQAVRIGSYLPPSSLEVLTVPVRAARAFLAGIWLDDISDVEGEGESANSPGDRGVPGKRFAVAWRGDDEPAIIRDPKSIEPGDRIMMPATYGGLDEFGWYPASDRPVKDIGDDATSQQRGLLQLRLHEGLISSWFQDPEDTKKVVDMLNSTLDKSAADVDVKLSELCDDLIHDLLKLPMDEHIRNILAELQPDSNRTVRAYPEERPEGILIRKMPPKKARLSREVLLADHCRGVAELSRTFASGCGLPNELATCEMLAGRAHDLGKADPRFQLSLYEADPILMCRANKLLSKSINPPADLATVRKYRSCSGYPKGARHECYSVALIESNEKLLNESFNRDLALHLVGAHHGRGRPLMPAIDDPGTAIRYDFDGTQISFCGRHSLEQLDSGWTDRFWQLNRRYGYWGLAYLEMLLRLADHSQSAQEEVSGDDA
jgi:CRISPR-associated endonuclease/helicase Cas3